MSDEALMELGAKNWHSRRGTFRLMGTYDPASDGHSKGSIPQVCPGTEMKQTLAIYVALLEEGTDCCRPVAAEHVGGDLYKIVGAEPEDERWQFQTGAIVRCRDHEFQSGTGLLAVEACE